MVSCNHHPSVHAFILHQSVIRPSIHPFLYPFICSPFIHSSIYLSLHSFIPSSIICSMSIHSSVVCLSIHPYFCPSIHPSVCLYINPFIYLSIHLFAIHPSIHLSAVYPFTCISIHPSTYLSIHPSFYLPMHFVVHSSIHPPTFHPFNCLLISTSSPSLLFFSLSSSSLTHRSPMSFPPSASSSCPRDSVGCRIGGEVEPCKKCQAWGDKTGSCSPSLSRFGPRRQTVWNKVRWDLSMYLSLF